MSKRSKFLKTLGVGALCLTGGFMFAGCGETKGSETIEPNQEIYAIYALAQSNGYTGTYDEWLASIKGEKGEAGENVELRVSNGKIQWKNTGDTTWNNLISLADLQGEQGIQGIQGIQGEQGLQGIQGIQGENVELRVNGEYIQWKNTGDTTWKNLVALSELKGAQGIRGVQGLPGEAGKGISSVAKTSSNGLIDTYTITYTDNTTSTFTITNGANGINGVKGDKGDDGITPTISISNDGYWVINGIKSETKAVGTNGSKGDKGDKGDPGQDATAATYTVTFDYGAALEYFSNPVLTRTVKSTESLGYLYEPSKSDIWSLFNGWYIKGTDIQLNKYSMIGSNITIEPRFDITKAKKAGMVGLFVNSAYVKTWNQLVEEYPLAFENNNTKIKYLSSDGFLEDLPVGNNSLIIDDSVIEIESRAIQGYLQYVEYPDKLETLNLDGAQVRVLPSGIKTINTSGNNDGVVYYKGTISDWFNVKATNFSHYKSLYVLKNVSYPSEGYEEVTDLIVPYSVTRIEEVELHFEGITSLYIHKNVNYIDNHCFRGVPLKRIKVNELNPVYDSREDCNAVIEKSSDWLILGSANTIIPENVKVIDSLAFSHKSISEIEIPDSVTGIGVFAFEYCTNLRTIKIGSGLKSINLTAFWGCKNIEKIEVSDQNEKYDSRNNCNAIIETSTNTLVMAFKTTIIPNDVTSICGSIHSDSIVITVNVERVTTTDNSGSKFSVYYKGAESQWSNIIITDNYAKIDEVYYYSEIQPVETNKYWHYDTDGVTPVIWGE